MFLLPLLSVFVGHHSGFWGRLGCVTVLCVFWLQAPSKKKIEINTIASNYHLEVNPRYLRDRQLHLLQHCYFYSFVVEL